MGNFLYRYRGIIGFVAFVIVYFFATPEYKSIFFSIPLLLVGLAIRVWAIGYIGKYARSKDISAQVLISAGPYRLIKHPLYLGNFFLVSGILIAMSPKFIISLIVLVLFRIEYSLISKTEEKYLNNRFRNAQCITEHSESISNQKFNWRNVLFEINTITIIVLIYGLIILKIYWR
ncbi:MAG: methyltransferase [candidate division WOR-3 bacterium]